MKLIYLLSLAAIPFLSFNDSKVKWLSPLEHDYGDIEQNVPKQHNFKFVNISDELLTIDNVRTSCGCTASDWEDEPTEASDTSAVNITYDAAKTGYFRKKIKVYFHGQRKAEILYIEGFVLEDLD
jgi:hypothetical protein